MRRTALAGLVSLACLWLFAALLGGHRLPSHTASAAVPASGLTVTAELFPLSDMTEFERHLTVSAAGGATLRIRMADLRGPADRMGLYRIGDGREFAVVGHAGDGDARFFAAGPLRRLEGPSRPSADWTCLGSFDLALVPNGRDPARGKSQVFAFVPAASAEQVRPVPAAAAAAAGGAEQVALLGGGAGRSCPLPGPLDGAVGRAAPGS